MLLILGTIKKNKCMISTYMYNRAFGKPKKNYTRVPKCYTNK